MRLLRRDHSVPDDLPVDTGAEGEPPAPRARDREPTVEFEVVEDED